MYEALHIRLPLCLILLFLAAGSNAYSADIADIVELKADRNSFRENFDELVQVSSEAVVGIHIGNSSGMVSVDDIFFPKFTGGELCVRAITQDGRYSSSNIYRSLDKIPQNAIFKLSPLTLNYEQKLEQYKVDALALKAFEPVDGECIPGRAIHIPQLLSQNETDRSITILVNSKGRISSLKFVGEPNESLCQYMKSEPGIAYDTICAIDIPQGYHGVKDIDIRLDDGFADENIALSLFIP